MTAQDAVTHLLRYNQMILILPQQRMLPYHKAMRLDARRLLRQTRWGLTLTDPNTRRSLSWQRESVPTVTGPLR